MRLSSRIDEIAYSPIRKLTPLADKAKERGVKVYHLNIGQPDIHTPECGLESLRRIDRKVLEYSPSDGFLSLRRRLSEYYSGCGMTYSTQEIVVTASASEALMFLFLTCLDPGDEIITVEPTYANYLTFAQTAGVRIVPVESDIRRGFALPSPEEFESRITPHTRAVLICNPNNPSGSLYSREELSALVDMVRRRGLYLFADEVYREFVYDGAEFISAGHFPEAEENVVIVDSFSKRFSECGIRVGCIATRNAAVCAGMMKLCQARLSPPLLGQIVAEASFDAGREYVDSVIREYSARRDVLVDGLRSIPGVFVPKPMGAFYVIAELPVDDAEKFCSWCLSDFEHEGATVMMAPASGFYVTPGLGRRQVRMAYVLNADDLRSALRVLSAAITAYRGIGPHAFCGMPQ